MEFDREKHSAKPSESPPVVSGGQDKSPKVRIVALKIGRTMETQTHQRATPSTGNVAAATSISPFSSTSPQHLNSSTSTTTPHDHEDNGKSSQPLPLRDLKQEAGKEDGHEAADDDADAEMESPDVEVDNAKPQT